mgnify:FL=1
MIELRPFSLQHINTHYRWNNDPELTFLDSEYPHKDESFESFLNRMKPIAEGKNPTSRLLEIFDEGEERLLGVIDIHAIDQHNRRCFIQITIGDRNSCNDDCQQQALDKALRYCFEHLDMHKVATTSFDFNTDWINLVKERGFKKEGALRDHVLKDDKFRDKYIFSLLEKEYSSQAMMA